MSDKKEPMSWLVIVAYMIAAGISAGLILGGLGTMFKLSSTITTSGVGAVIGVVGALLMTQRNAKIAKQKDSSPS